MLPLRADSEGSTEGSSSAAERARVARVTGLVKPNPRGCAGVNGRGWDRTSDLPHVKRRRRSGQFMPDPLESCQLSAFAPGRRELLRTAGGIDPGRLGVD